jgi:hypothetical protein
MALVDATVTRTRRKTEKSAQPRSTPLAACAASNKAQGPAKNRQKRTSVTRIGLEATNLRFFAHYVAVMWLFYCFILSTFFFLLLSAVIHDALAHIVTDMECA